MTSQQILGFTIAEHLGDEIIAFAKRSINLKQEGAPQENLIDEIETQIEDLLAMLTQNEQRNLKNELINDFRDGAPYALGILEILDENLARNVLEKQYGEKPKAHRSKGPYNHVYFLAHTPDSYMAVKFTGLNKDLEEKLRTAHLDGNLRAFTEIPETAEEFLNTFRGFGFTEKDAENILRKAQGMKRALKLYDVRTFEQDMYFPAIPDYR